MAGLYHEFHLVLVIPKGLVLGLVLMYVACVIGLKWYEVLVLRLEIYSKDTGG